MAAPATAKKKKKKKPPVRVERVVDISYSAPGAGVSGPAGTASGGICPFADPTTQQCIEVPLEPGDKYIKVEITDTSGQNVAGYISQGDTDGDGIGNLYGDFCGGHEEFIPLESPSAPVRISFYNGVCADNSPAIATTGTITVTFSNLP
jgi:hypothetical protein